MFAVIYRVIKYFKMFVVLWKYLYFAEWCAEVLGCHSFSWQVKQF